MSNSYIKGQLGNLLLRATSTQLVGALYEVVLDNALANVWTESDATAQANERIRACMIESLHKDLLFFDSNKPITVQFLEIGQEEIFTIVHECRDINYADQVYAILAETCKPGTVWIKRGEEVVKKADIRTAQFQGGK